KRTPSRFAVNKKILQYSCGRVRALAPSVSASAASTMTSAVGNERPAEEPIPRVTAGVFFGSPVALPRGPHALPRADVVAEQRERLMAAMTELIAAGGYTRVTIGALASRAKIPRPAFYRCFPSKAACAYAAYDRFIEVLLGALVQRADAR